MASRVHTAINAIVAALNAAPAVTSAATVYDGPFITGDSPPVAVHVGYDGDPGGDMRATEGWTQEWAGLGALRKDERFDVLCCVVAWTGDDDVAGMRAAAVGMASAVEDTLRSVLNIGLGLPQPTIAEYSQADLFQEQGPGGMQARIPFTISIRTRI